MTRDTVRTPLRPGAVRAALRDAQGGALDCASAPSRCGQAPGCRRDSLTAETWSGPVALRYAIDGKWSQRSALYRAFTTTSRCRHRADCTDGSDEGHADTGPDDATASQEWQYEAARPGVQRGTVAGIACHQPT